MTVRTMRALYLLIAILCTIKLSASDLSMEGWVELPVGGNTVDSISQSYVKESEISRFKIRHQVTRTCSNANNIDNIIGEIEIKKMEDGDDKYVHVSRYVSLRNENNGYWLFLNSFGDSYQIYGGLAGKNGNYFANSGEKFIAITPKDLAEDKAFWVLMFIADSQGVYQLYDKPNAAKFNSVVKK